MAGEPEAVLFDLDGTLADTAPDLAFALNETLKHYGKPQLSLEKIRPVVSYGGMGLIKLGFKIKPTSPDFEEKRQFLLNIYQNNLCLETKLFHGMDKVLDYLEGNNIAWGIVTNKPGWLTNPLMKAMKLEGRTKAIISGDTCKERKPHPDPVLFACRVLGVAARESWFVGDASRDMAAGRAAGCKTIGASFGYIHPEDPIENWDSDYLIREPIQIIDLIKNRNSS
tara:strand:+ start:13586 stop:14260 length:675 start_codon:yes stop_codon:yes gene_type:complete